MEARKSKTKNIDYSNLHMQEYLQLKTITRMEALILFKFRTRMAPFKENFKSGQFISLCPLCLSHVDSQENSFICETFKKIFTIKGNYKDLFTNHIPDELVKSLYNIYTYRKEFEE